MAKIIFRLPSKAIQYGYVEVEASPEELGFEDVSDANVLGAIYATYVGAFLEGEKGGLDLFMRGRSESAPEGRTGARTDEEAVAILQKELGATVVSEEAPPWERKAEAKQPKPWEKKAEGAPSQIGGKSIAPMPSGSLGDPHGGATPKIEDINW